MRHLVFSFALLFAGVAPLARQVETSDAARDSFPGWPGRFEGRPLEPLPLEAIELQLATTGANRIARFSDGQREIILRWVPRMSHRVHTASLCLKGTGHQVAPHGLWRDSKGEAWTVLRATREGKILWVRERITDSDGQSFADTSSWWWAERLGRTRGPWWLVSVGQSSPFE